MKERKLSKKKSQQILATLVMGMNLVNSMAPMAVAMQKLPAEGELQVEPAKSEAKPLEYTVLPQMLDFVDNVVFGKAEARVYDVGSGETRSVANLISGDFMRVSFGGIGIADIMGAYGSMCISSGGTGIISTVSGGLQHISSGGTSIVDIASAGAYYIDSRAIGTVSMMYSGLQFVSGGGTGTISTMSGGVQDILSGGEGTVSTMSGGTQDIYSGGAGTVSTMSGGTQDIYSGGTGTVDTMSSGYQFVFNEGTAYIDTLNDGYQTLSGGTGAVNIMNDGHQNIYSGGTGNVSIISGGTQNVYNSGIINMMSGGTQNIFSGGTGIVSNMDNGNQFTLDSGIGIIEVMNNGYQTISSGGTGTVSNMNGGHQHIYSAGTAVDTIMNDGHQFIYNNAAALNTTINGGTAVMLGELAIVEDVTMTGGEYLLGADGGSYHIGGKFEFTGGNIDMAKSIPGMTTGTYETLTIDNLQKGGGTFIMDTDLVSETNGDKIKITNAEAGSTYYVQVKDASLINSTPVLGEKKLLLITDASKNATFIGKEINNGGIWEITPDIKKGTEFTDENGNTVGATSEWYLTNLQKKVNNDTEVLLDGTDNSYALWRNTNDTLRKRLGDLHYRTNEIDGDGIWARYTGGKFGGSGFDSSYNMYQLGYDKADNAKSTYGFAVESGTGHADYSFGSGKDKLFSGSFYGTWTGDDGSYTDVVAKIGQFDADIKSYGDYPDKASYKNRAYSVSVEYGKTIEVNEKSGTFIEPQLQFIAGRLSSSEYTTDRGNNVYIGGLNSYIGRVGFVAGQKTKDGNDVYFKASALHEFGGSRDIHMEAANGETLSMSKDYSDTWFEVGIGTNIKLSKASYFYGDIERSFGGEIEKKWQINAGVRFEF